MHVFVVGAPFSGARLLSSALSRGDGTWTAGSFLELPRTGPQDRGDRLDAGDAGALAAQVRERFQAALTDREGRGPGPGALDGATALVGAEPRLALSVPLLVAAFPAARFVHLRRDAAATRAQMLAAWRAGTHRNGADLDGWSGPAWSLPLVPGWRALDGADLPEIVAAQHERILATLDDDLAEVAADRRRDVGYEELVEDPRSVLRELCDWLGVRYDQALLGPVEQEQRRRTAGPATPGAATPYDSVSTDSFSARLRAAGGSLLVSTYQTGKLVCARADGDGLNTHFRDFDKPMGLAVGPGRIALGTRTEVWDLRDMPKLAPRIEPVGRHDACYLPRNRHVTGDIAVHEMAFAQGTLWVVATAFSCLATLDADHSFVPRWTPPFISAVAPGDRCHLNGLAVVDGQVRYVTALGTTDEPRGWTAAKAAGGVLIDVPSNEIVVRGLSMPHSPRWHDGALWVLQSGRGELCRVDLDRGVAEPVVELPGFTRGLAIVGRTAFVGLSQIRESSSFGDLPVTHRLPERQSGVWMVDLDRATVAGFLRFDDLVQEIFDVAFLPGARYPEIADPTSSAVAQAYALP